MRRVAASYSKTDNPSARRQGLTPLTSSSAPQNTALPSATALRTTSRGPCGFRIQLAAEAAMNNQRAVFGIWAMVIVPVIRLRKHQTKNAFIMDGGFWRL